VKTSGYIIAAVLGIAAAVVIHRAMRRRSAVPTGSPALDPNAWADEQGISTMDASAQWVYDTYVRQAAAR
jgi:hypothetical protein